MQWSRLSPHRFLRVSLGALVAWLLAVLPVFAAEPAVVLSIKGFNELLTDSQYLGNVLGQPLLGAALPGVVAQVTGGKGLNGLDATKPIGLYVTLSSDGQPKDVVVFVPVSSQKTFADTLAAVFPNPSTENGITKYQPPRQPNPIFAKAGAKHFFLAQSAESLADLADPDKLVKSTSDIAVEFDLTKFSDQQKEQVLAQIEAGAALAGQNDVSDNEAERRGREAGQKMALAAVRRLVLDGERFNLSLNIDSKAKAVSLDVGFTAKPGTDLAAACASYGQTSSPFASLTTQQTLGSLLISTPLAQDAKDVFNLVADEAEKGALAGAKSDAERELAKQFGAKLRQSIRLDRLDHAYIVNMTMAGKLQLVLAAKIAKGNELKQLVDDLIRKNPNASNRIQLGVATANGVRIDSIPAPADPDFEKHFGNDPVHLAVSDDLIVVSVGTDSLSAVKATLESKAGKSARSPVSLRVGLSKLLPLAPNADSRVLEISKTAFSGSNDEIALEIASQPNGASIRFEVREGVLKLIGLVGAARGLR